MRRVDPRWVLIVALYAAAGLAMAWFLVDSTAIGADLATYQRASRNLWEHGNPYLGAADVGADFRYRYPPLLAMLWPLLALPAVWFALIAACTAFPIWLAIRERGWVGVLPALLLIGPWGQQLLNGNAQAIVIALLAIVPIHARAGAVGLAVATMLKLHPVIGIIWYAGRRQWSSLAWFAGATAFLLLIQAPWLGAFLDYYLTDATATDTVAGLSLRAFGTPVWPLGIAVFTYLAWRHANGRWGWMLNVILQLVALPRVLLVNLALLLAAPLPGRRTR
ncbi:MAG: hypothetical protein IT341_08965 [Chloroflexi bacterium]|nr:hypothetical protein [Chloroflexota bacterium]